MTSPQDLNINPETITKAKLPNVWSRRTEMPKNQMDGKAESCTLRASRK